MATRSKSAESSSPSVSVIQADNGDVTLGATIDGVFVPFQTLSGAHVGRYIEKANASSESSSDESGTEG